ncbi:predicted protein [Histoplasma capsulatum H143]|uniref:Uncharacterized protein n=1 Tax=Ajellomyces capsulatus (strain H143) TaxID=544712 RepID=C6HQE2_AJECH|nr:predicted protein [Histoplasma capsulatum H143]
MSKEPEKRARGTGERTLWSQSRLDAQKHLDETLGERIAAIGCSVLVCQRMRKEKEEEELQNEPQGAGEKMFLSCQNPRDGGDQHRHYPELERVPYRTVVCCQAPAAAGRISSSIKQLQTILSAGSTRDGDAIGEGNQQVQSNQLQTIPGQQWTCSLEWSWFKGPVCLLQL